MLFILFSCFLIIISNIQLQFGRYLVHQQETKVQLHLFNILFPKHSKQVFCKIVALSGLFQQKFIHKNGS